MNQRRRGERAQTLPYQPAKRPTQSRRVKVRAEQGYCNQPIQTEQSLRGLKQRMILVVFALSVGFSLLGAQLGEVALAPAVEPQASIRDLPIAAPQRGTIYDRNGVLLATTLAVKSVYLDPQRVMDSAETVAKIATILPDIQPDRLHARMADPRLRFVWVKRHVTPEQAYQINALGLPGVGFRQDYVRVYPGQSLAAHVLGGVSRDGRGLAGIEMGYERELAAGQSIHLTLDSRLQNQLEETLAQTQAKNKAKAAWGAVLSARTGELLAMASIPDYDPNRFHKAKEHQKFNPITLGRYEMGSTFKLFTLAQGLATGEITLETPIDARYPFKIDKFTINDFHAKKRVLSALEVMRYSSNIGAAQIADKIGVARQQAFFSDLGLLEPVDIGLPETTGPSYPAQWGRVHTITMSYGHGIAVTPLQLLAAVATLATDGTYRAPRLVKDRAALPPRPVLSPAVLPQVKELMRDVVLHGSGRNALVPGLDVGGKTGTAEKVAAQGYQEDKNLVSFIGAVPLTDPQYVILIMVDEPDVKFPTGGWVAAPAFQDFVTRSAPLLALQTQMPATTAAVQVAKAPATRVQSNHSKPKQIKSERVVGYVPKPDVSQLIRPAAVPN